MGCNTLLDVGSNVFVLYAPLDAVQGTPDYQTQACFCTPEGLSMGLVCHTVPFKKILYSLNGLFSHPIGLGIMRA